MWFRRICHCSKHWRCFAPLLGLRFSIWEADAAHEVLKAWFGTEGIEHWIHVEVDHQIVPLLIALFEPLHCTRALSPSLIYTPATSTGGA